MKRLILCDFDGTVSLRDMGYVLLNQFSSGDWKAIDRDFSNGKIGSRMAYSRIEKIIQGDQESVLHFVRSHSDIDPCFVSFYRYCREQGIDVKIISDGLDFYIQTLLELHHLSEVPFYANRTRFHSGDRMEFSFPFLNKECGLCGTCKKKLVQEHRNNYDSILFVGNGRSDRCAAHEADFTFAKDPLYSYCIEHNLTCHSFESFAEILSDLRKRIRGILFDLDGTLIEAYGAIYLGLKESLHYFGKEIFSFGELKNYLKADLETTLSHFFSAEEIPRAVAIMRKKYGEVFLDHTYFLDGAKEVLESLRSQGILMGVASNKFGRFSRRALSHLGVSDYFKTVIGAGDVPRNKPYPDMIHAAVKEMNLPPEEVVFVGDTPTDIETGKEARVDVYALPTGFHSKVELSQKKPKRILRNLQELPRVVENIFS